MRMLIRCLGQGTVQTLIHAFGSLADKPCASQLTVSPSRVAWIHYTVLRSISTSLVLYTLYTALLILVKYILILCCRSYTVGVQLGVIFRHHYSTYCTVYTVYLQGIVWYGKRVGSIQLLSQELARGESSKFEQEYIVHC